MTRIGGIMAGGQGTRLQEVGHHKPLLRVAGMALIDHVIDQLMQASLERLIVECRPDDLALQEHIYGRADIVHAEPLGGGTGASMRRILAEVGHNDCVISTVDTIAPPGAYARLVESAYRPKSGTLAMILATRFIHDESPIWIKSSVGGSRVIDYGKQIPSTGLCFGNVRWLSASAVEELSTLPPSWPERDTVLMRHLLSRYPNSTGYIIEDPIFDIDDESDIRLAEEWLNSQ
jgi:NDP-sugar pyrophosphorylase family protein